MTRLRLVLILCLCTLLPLTAVPASAMAGDAGGAAHGQAMSLIDGAHDGHCPACPEALADPVASAMAPCCIGAACALATADLSAPLVLARDAAALRFALPRLQDRLLAIPHPDPHPPQVPVTA
jgi:hypothetical protein